MDYCAFASENRLLQDIIKTLSSDLTVHWESKIMKQILESEFFGHVKGAFTGAERNRDGFFMIADKGTLIMDGIGQISPFLLAKPLKFLQDKEVKLVRRSLLKTWKSTPWPLGFLPGSPGWTM